MIPEHPENLPCLKDIAIVHAHCACLKDGTICLGRIECIYFYRKIVKVV